MKKKLVSFLAIAALLAQSSGVYAQKKGMTRAEEYGNSPEYRKRFEYLDKVVMPKVYAQIKEGLYPPTVDIYTLLIQSPSQMILSTSPRTFPNQKPWTAQQKKLIKQMIKHALWPELAQKVFENMVAWMEGDKERAAQTYKEVNNLFFEMNRLTQSIKK